MNSDTSRLRHLHREESIDQTQHDQQQHLQQTGKEFASVEELLRHDADQTAVPTGLQNRLAISIANEPKPVLPWWRRLFSK